MPTSAIIGKAAAAYVLAGIAREMPIRQVIDVGAGCGTYRRLLGPFLPEASWRAIEIWPPYVDRYRLEDLYDSVLTADAATFDFGAVEGGGAILFGDVLDRVPIYRAGEMAASAMRHFDVAMLSFPTGQWPAAETGGNPHEAQAISWFKEDLDRRFAETLAGVIHHDLNPGQSISVAFLGRSEDIRAALAARIEAFRQELARDAALADCGFDFAPNYLDPAVVGKFHKRMRALLGIPSLSGLQFADLGRFLEIKSLVDAGCGDFTWMQPLSGAFSLYLGIDKDPALITDLDYRFGGLRGHFFSCRDVGVHPLPAVDAILCRDLFSGQSVEAVQAILANIKASGSRYMMASTVPGGPAPLDLTAAPFNLPLPLVQFEDELSPGAIMGVWLIPGS